MVIFLLMMATAFMGYVLPWGQMSFWGATVITGFFTAFPVIGEPIQQLLLGGFAVGNQRLAAVLAVSAAVHDCRVICIAVWALCDGSDKPDRH